MSEVIYENDNGKLKITKQVTEEVLFDKDMLVAERNELLNRLASLEQDYLNQRNFFAGCISEIDEKITKCTELGIKTKTEITAENI